MSRQLARVRVPFIPYFFFFNRIKNFNKILKNIKNLVKNNFFFIFINKYFKNFFLYKGKNNFLIIYKNIKKKILKKNILNIFYLSNIGNICSCIRTSFLFNVYTIINYIFLKINFYYNNIIFVKSIFKIINFYKKNNVIICLSINSKRNILKIKNKINFMIIIGNEKFGICKKILKMSDLILKIKTYSKKCLNVNVVIGITLHNFNEL